MSNRDEAASTLQAIHDKELACKDRHITAQHKVHRKVVAILDREHDMEMDGVRKKLKVSNSSIAKLKNQMVAHEAEMD